MTFLGLLYWLLNPPFVFLYIFGGAIKVGLAAAVLSVHEREKYFRTIKIMENKMFGFLFFSWKLFSKQRTDLL